MLLYAECSYNVTCFCSVPSSDDRIVFSKVRAKYWGAVEWSRLGQFSSSCDIDVTWFPYDEQVCELKFMSWDDSGEMSIVDFQQLSRGIDYVNTKHHAAVSINDEDDWIYADNENSTWNEEKLPTSSADQPARYDGEWKIVGMFACCTPQTCFSSHSAVVIEKCAYTVSVSCASKTIPSLIEAELTCSPMWWTLALILTLAYIQKRKRCIRHIHTNSEQ
jgi:Neurotransmitter-gated ion-channel ligand binding domain